jgi:hypothetical protein
MFLQVPVERLKEAARLFSLTAVKGPEECWIFEGHLNKDGYGKFKNSDGLCVGAHTTSFELIHGLIPEGEEVLHSCDIRPCINPYHLSSGTRQENMADCSAKGRNRTPRPGNGFQKLSSEDIAEIGRLSKAGMKTAAIGRLYEMSGNGILYNLRKYHDHP